jgi:hypothetical protein
LKGAFVNFEQAIVDGTDWDPSIPMCGNWQGVLCGPMGHVQELNFSFPMRQMPDSFSWTTNYTSGSAHASPQVPLRGESPPDRVQCLDF